MKIHIFVAVTLLLGLVALPMNVSAAVTANVVLITTSPITGEPISFSYTKSSEVGDGQQTGSVVATYTGPESGTLETKNYDVAETVNAVLTWTDVFFWAPGTYTVTFDDTVSAGTEVDDSLIIEVAAAYTKSWSAAISEPAGFDAMLSTLDKSLAVDAGGNAVVTWRQRLSGDATTWDSGIASYSKGGALRWSQITSSSPGSLVVNPIILNDNAGRIWTIQCIQRAGALDELTARIYNPSNGASEELIDLTTLGMILPSTCTVHMSADAAVNPGGLLQYYLLMGGTARFTGHNADMSLKWTTSAIDPGDEGGVEAHGNQTYVLVEMRRESISSTPRIRAQSEATGGLIADAALFADNPGFIAHSPSGPGAAFFRISDAATDCSYNTGSTSAAPGGTASIACPVFIQVGDTTGSDDYNALTTTRGPVFFLDNNDRAYTCAQMFSESSQRNIYVTTMSNAGVRLGGIDLSSIDSNLLGPTTGVSPCYGIKPDGANGFYTWGAAISPTTPGGTDTLVLTHLVPHAKLAYATPAIETQTTGDVPGSGGAAPGGGNITGGPLVGIQDLFDEGWGTSPAQSDWIFAVLIIVISAFGFGGLMAFHPIAIGVGTVAGVMIAWALGFLPTWFLLLGTFIVIAFASTRLFGGGGDEAS